MRNQDGMFLPIPGSLKNKVQICKAWKALELGQNLDIPGRVSHLQAAFEEQNKEQEVFECLSSTEDCW